VTCPAGATNGNLDCALGTDVTCQTACTNKMQSDCVCAPHGGSGSGRWVCGTVACP
jgi:hypothetical protein